MEVYGMKIRLTFLICFIDFWYNVSFFDLLTFPDEITKPKLGQKNKFDIYKAVPPKNWNGNFDSGKWHNFQRR